MESLLRRLEARDFRRLRVGVGPPVLLRGTEQCVVDQASPLTPAPLSPSPHQDSPG